ncbi:envelope glycoprotein [Simian foamy virus Pongo pygmaeus pygmaeus]|uniref:Envelope glycoprotein gp130 n=1 Tax=Simian foamy virus Pongo pygmaeus pygmaeus TaxID=221703 RepID=Q7SIS5_9RETR|nr:envelope glycoprotein [Simian foamy virus Pongo pygmaeus pygmaeus]CAD67563.1 envelope glycoprotein [Simian foamy virus Pongo pygmaeus pygmaeus]
MAPPMTLQQWLVWDRMQKANEALKSTTAVSEEEKEHLILEIQNEEIIPTKVDRVKYLLYTCCATTTRTLAWLFLFCVLLIVVLVTCFITIARIQWNQDIQVYGPVIDWNISHQAIYKPLLMKRLARSIRTHYPIPKNVEVNMTSIPQGVYYEPHPEPIIVKERVLGLSQVIMINSETVANSANLTQEAKVLLADMVNEELQGLADVMIDFEIPLGDPRDQDQYIHRKCFQEFAHCYLVKYKDPKGWPSEKLIVDQCPIPGVHIPSIYKYQAIWDYYIPFQMMRPENWKAEDVYGQARIESYYVPKIFQNNNISHVLFCSDRLYNKWYTTENTLLQNEELLIIKLTNLTKKDAQLKERALPPSWSTEGKSLLFREANTLDICNIPEAILLLNTTYYNFSLWEGDCGYDGKNITNMLTSCKDFYTQASKSKHPYACRFWRYKTEKEETKCYDNKDKTRCLYFPKWDTAEELYDFGFLAYLGHFPSPICIKEHKIKEVKYSVYSLYQECINKASTYGIGNVVEGIKELLNSTGTPVNEMPNARAFVGLVNPDFPPLYKNKTSQERESCFNRRNRRSLDNNYVKLRSMGYSLTGAVQTLSKISDINDENLQQGLYLLRDHLVTLMEATLHDISLMEGMLAVQHLHTHLNHFKTMLLERRIDWTFINSDWLQQQLQQPTDHMKIIKRTARSLVYYVEQTSNSPTATSWEVGIYYEIIIPKHIYLNNWQIKNIGHLIHSAGQLTHVTIDHPYEILNRECEETKYLHLEQCIKQDYVICDIVERVQPCGNTTGTTDCAVYAKAIKSPYTEILPLKNGSYLVLSDSTSCNILPYIPSIVTVNETVECFGVLFKKPLTAERKTDYTPHIPPLRLRLPHLLGIIAKLKNIKIEVTSTQENIKDQIERAKAELLRLDIHEGDSPAWIKQLAAATEDVWPTLATGLKSIGNFLSDAAQGIFGTAFGILGYVKPILIGVGIILLIVVIFKIISWIPIKRKSQ